MGCALGIAALIALVFPVANSKATDILESASAAATGMDWNQGSQWADGLVPAPINNYVLITNTANNSGLVSYYRVSFGIGYIRTPVNGSATVSYNVKCSTASSAEATITNVAGTTFTNLDLLNGTKYYYKVSALSGSSNESGNSAEVHATPVEAAASPKILKVYLQGGQSNSDGRGLTNGLPPNLLNPQNDVPFYYYLAGAAANGDGTPGTFTSLRPGASALGGGTTFGPELSFGRALADYFAVTNGVSTNTVLVAIIKYAHGGTSLVSDWEANGNSSMKGDGPDYVISQQVVATGMARLAAEFPSVSIELSGMIWVQGETDIDLGAASSTAYGTNLVRFVNDIRSTYATNQPYGTNLPFFVAHFRQPNRLFKSCRP